MAADEKAEAAAAEFAAAAAKAALGEEDELDGEDEGTADDKGSSGGGNEDTVSKKRRERLEQNRISARESRKRKKTMIEELQRTVITLSRENKELNERNEQLRSKLMEIGAKVSDPIALDMRNVQIDSAERPIDMWIYRCVCLKEVRIENLSYIVLNPWGSFSSSNLFLDLEIVSIASETQYPSIVAVQSIMNGGAAPGPAQPAPADPNVAAAAAAAQQVAVQAGAAPVNHLAVWQQTAQAQMQAQMQQVAAAQQQQQQAAVAATQDPPVAAAAAGAPVAPPATAAPS